jgi:hypothetical protein
VSNTTASGAPWRSGALDAWQVWHVPVMKPFPNESHVTIGAVAHGPSVSEDAVSTGAAADSTGCPHANSSRAAITR